jgi:aldose 1-epimerase
MSASAAVGPTGHQYEISGGGYRAVVTELGAALRVLQSGERDLINGFGPDDRIVGGRGQQLLPWPNRIRDGRYQFADADHQLALTEPTHHNAMHGLVRWQPCELLHHGTDVVTQQATVFPQPGWDTTLQCQISYRVSAEGLDVTVAAENVGDRPVPFGYAAHPYLTVGEQTVDEISVAVPADSYLQVDDRMLPVGLQEVGGHAEDLRSGKPLGPVTLDTAFTELARDADGTWRVVLTRGDHHTALWGDSRHRWVQVFTGTDRSHGLAVEPMTCGPDAFNSTVTEPGLVTLAPGQQYQGRWGIWGR